MINLLFFLVGVLFGAFGHFLLVQRTKRVGEMEYIPTPELKVWKAATPGFSTKHLLEKFAKKEEGAVIMPDRADVIKRDDLKIDDLLL